MAETNPFNLFAIDFSKFDLSKLDVTKMLGDVKIPVFDMEAIIAAQRKNIEALNAASQVAVQDMQALAQQQAEILSHATNEVEQLIADSPQRLTADFQEGIKPVKRFNQMLDRAFYDVASLTEQEQEFLSQQDWPEGQILAVERSGIQAQGIEPINQDAITQWDITTVVIPGVGSSAFGAAALARNVADFLKAKVAAIVAGYGLERLLSDAIGGSLVLGANNQLRHAAHSVITTHPTLAPIAHGMTEVPADATVQKVFDWRQECPKFLSSFQSSNTKRETLDGSSECIILYNILTKKDCPVRLLVGHSKGSLSIAFALHALANAHQPLAAALGSKLNIVTMGAVTAMPQEFTQVRQFLGGLDLFGWLNSRHPYKYQVVPAANHWTNPQYSFAMKVAQVLSLALGERP